MKIPKKKKIIQKNNFTEQIQDTCRFLNMDNKRWPVNKFTAKRTPKVSGRINFLTTSTMFIKGISNTGLPGVV